jgi:pimeloyl-ACP methyl ester carboxylesterase
MQRPVMDPMLLLDDEPLLPSRPKSPAREHLDMLLRGARWVGRVLFSKPFRVRHRDPDKAKPLAVRLARGLAYRMLFVPIFVALAASALVYRGTHPFRAFSDKLPLVPHTFHETLEFNGPDGHPLMAWFVPVVDAKRVIEMRDKVFRGKQPAVVLVHDYNESPSQMVPLIQPLHEQGFIVMAVGLRGIGRPRVAAQTFGLNEAVDVRGALAELRKRSTVDAERVVLVGVGTGANAAVIAASHEPCVKALVLVNAARTAEDVVADRVGPRRPGTRWMQVVSKWAFEVAFQVDAEDLTLSRFRDVLSTRPLLAIDRRRGDELDPETVGKINAFCAEQLGTVPTGTVASGQ